MGTRPISGSTKEVERCNFCNKTVTPECDWRQGRCPHRPSMLDYILEDTYKSRFYNLLKFFKGKK